MNQIDLLNEARQEEALPSPCFDDFNHKIKYDDEYYARYIHHFKPNPGKRLAYRFIKRSFDVILALLLLVFLLPLFAVIAIAIKCDSKGPVLFIQKRVGKNSKVFNCYKFRSMSVDAPSECATSQLKNPHLYLTRVGRFLRRFSLDELPQIWCVSDRHHVLRRLQTSDPFGKKLQRYAGNALRFFYAPGHYRTGTGQRQR